MKLIQEQLRQLESRNEELETKFADVTKANLELQVAEQGDKVRQLKGNKAEKAAVDAEVALLLDLKKKLSLASGQPLQQPSGKKGKKK